MPKGHTKYSKYESLLLKTGKMLAKINTRLEGAAAELASRPDPVVAPKAKTKPTSTKSSQLKLPGVKRKAAKRAATAARRKR